MTHAIVWVRPPVARLDLESFARAAGMHPGMVGRLVALGLLEPDQDAAGACGSGRASRPQWHASWAAPRFPDRHFLSYFYAAA